MTPPGHRRLILVRHAKSDWGQKGLGDHDRPLNGRGRRAARELGGWVASRDHLPDEVLCSDARRTVETWEAIAESLPHAPAPAFLPGLYHAEAEELFACLKAAAGQTVMMVGHNPGLGAFAAMLPATPPADPDFARYPTAATLVVDFQIDGWAELAPATGSVMDFFTPSERGG